MTLLLWAWTALTALTAVVWILRHVQISVARRRMPPLRSADFSDAPPGDGLPAVSLLVAAKDEEANIDTCVRSLIAQDYPRLQVIAVNDRSADRTPEILDRLAAAAPDRLRAVHVRRLREGWFGKNNAMREGIDLAEGDWLAFTDADCQFISPRCLTVAVRFALHHQADFVSLLPNLETNSFWERVIQPACAGILLIWFNPLRVNDPRRPAAYANGAFMLMRRDCYDAIGRHDAVRTEVNEDIHLARRAKAAGRRLLVVSNDDLYTVRMYNTFRQSWAGWSRIFYGCFGGYRKILVSMALVGLFSLLPWATLAAALPAVASGAGHSLWRGLAAAAASACAAQLSVMLRFYALSRSSPLFGLLYPLGALVAVAALFNAARRLRGRAVTAWRGTVYRGDRVESAPG